MLRGLGEDLGADVVACRAWPGLATRLAAWQSRGLPLAEMIADLPTGRLAKARFPAAYAKSVLAATVAARGEDHGVKQSPDQAPTPGRGSTQGSAEGARGGGSSNATAKRRAHAGLDGTGPRLRC